MTLTRSRVFRVCGMFYLTRNYRFSLQPIAHNALNFHTLYTELKASTRGENTSFRVLFRITS